MIKSLTNDEDMKGSTLSDINDSDIHEYLLSEEEALVKSIVWHHMHKEWIDEQAHKAKLPIKKTVKGPGTPAKKKWSKMQLINAENSLTAISKFSELAGKVNPEVAGKLFDTSMPYKRQKIEDSDEEDMADDHNLAHIDRFHDLSEGEDNQVS
jgi:hypothetical protein